MTSTAARLGEVLGVGKIDSKVASAGDADGDGEGDAST